MAPIGFLSFPPEIRNKIYSLVLINPTSIELDHDHNYWAEYTLKLTAQLLRTCLQIHTEALPILYGEHWQ